jgi:hypothetical protein
VIDDDKGRAGEADGQDFCGYNEIPGLELTNTLEFYYSGEAGATVNYLAGIDGRLA